MRQQGEPITAQFAPGTRITIPKLNKIDGAIELGAPDRRLDTCRIAIDLNERAGTKQRVHHEIVRPYVAVLGVADIKVLKQ